MGRILLALSILCAVVLRADEKPLPPEITDVQSKLKQTEPTKIWEALAKAYGSGFTAATGSKSRQGSHRLVAFGDTGKVIIGIGENGDSLEAVVDSEGDEGLVPYDLRISDQHPNSDRALCARCHGPEFVYIFRGYRRPWKGFFGEFDDSVSDEKELEKFRKTERFAAFFAPGDEDKFYPYWNGKDKKDRKISRMPNTRLAAILGSRTADRVLNKIKKAHPDRFEKWKRVLSYYLTCDGSDFDKREERQASEAKLRQAILVAIREAMPNDAPRWESIFSEQETLEKKAIEKLNERFTFDRYRNAQEIVGRNEELALLHLLGVPPHGIILSESLNGKDPLASPKAYKDFMQQYALVSMQGDLPARYSPLDFLTGNSDLRGTISYRLLSQMKLWNGFVDKQRRRSDYSPVKGPDPFYEGAREAFVKLDNSLLPDEMLRFDACQELLDSGVASIEKPVKSEAGKSDVVDVTATSAPRSSLHPEASTHD